MHVEELSDLFSSSNNISTFKSKGMGWQKYELCVTFCSRISRDETTQEAQAYMEILLKLVIEK